MEFLFWLLVLLVVITLLGHGIWVTVATLIRILNGEPRTSAKCPVCHTALGYDSHNCDACDWSAHATSTGGPLRIGLRMLKRASDRQLLDEDAIRTVGDAMIQAAKPTAPPTRGTIFRESPAAEAQDIPALGSPTSRPAQVATPRTPKRDEARPEETTSPVAPAPTPEADRPAPDIAKRARRFASHQTAPLADTAEQPSREIPKVQRKPWSELLSAFMQEKNIRWGEVVGGLLIVSSSIALVISFWEHIAAQPLLKFGIFTGVTAALFGLGLHASHRWKLATTSQGVLIITMMLVPLNFLAMASFAEASELTASSIVGEFVTLGVFLLLGYYASRILTPRFAGLTDLLVVGLGFYNLPIRRFVFGDTTWETLYAVALPMVAAYLVSLWPLRRSDSILLSDEDDTMASLTSQLWKLLGLASFAFVLATGFLIVRTERFGIAFQRLSPLFMLAAAPSILIGARLWQTAKARELRWLLVPSCGVWLAGIGVMLAGIGLSWPIPWLMIATCAIGALMCLVLAIWLRLPEIHIGVAALLSISFALAGLVAGGAIAPGEPNGRSVLAELLSVATGFWYTGYSVLMLGVAVLLRTMSRTATARSYGIGGVVGGLVGAALITAYGFGRPEHAISVSVAYSVYAVLFYLAAHYSKNTAWQWLSGAAIAGACFQGIYFGLMHAMPVPYRLLITLLTASAIYMLVAIGEQLAKPRDLQVSRIEFQWPFETLALVGLCAIHNRCV